jgi:hypothetical protein
VSCTSVCCTSGLLLFSIKISVTASVRLQATTRAYHDESKLDMQRQFTLYTKVILRHAAGQEAASASLLKLQTDRRTTCNVTQTKRFQSLITLQTRQVAKVYYNIDNGRALSELAQTKTKAEPAVSKAPNMAHSARCAQVAACSCMELGA